MHKYLIIFFLAFGLIIGCSDDDSPSGPTDASLFVVWSSDYGYPNNLDWNLAHGELKADSSYQVNVTIQNRGTSAYVVQSVTSSNAKFTIDFNSAQTINAGDSLVVSAFFLTASGEFGLNTGTFTFNTTDPKAATIQVSFRADVMQTTWDDGAGGHYAMINATSHASFSYFNLISGATVSLSDEAANTNSDWHIAFKRYNGRLNGGISGPGNVVGVNLAKLSHNDSTNFEAIVTVPPILDTDWMSDEATYPFGDNWYAYNPVTHQLSVNHHLFVVRTADGKYAKVVIDSLKNPGRPPNMGTIGFKFFYQADGSGNLNGVAQYVEVDGSSGMVYFSFAAGGAVEADSTGLNWDLVIDNYTIKLNGGISGSGQAACLPLGETTFESQTMVPAGAPLFTDSFKSIFGSATEAGSEWYDYTDLHELVSKGHVYIIRIGVGTYYKLTITNYYRVIEGNPVSGWITLRYKQL